MLKYRKAFLLAIIFSITVLIYTFLIREEYRNIRVMNAHMFHDFAYMFVFFCFLFYLYFEKDDYDLMACRFRRLKDYYIFKIKKTIVSIIIFFVVLTINEIIIFIIFDPLFQISSLVFRNIILLSLSSLFYLISFVGQRKYYLRKMMSFFIIWNFLYITFIIFPGSIINSFGIFNILENFNIIEIEKFLLLNVIVIYICYLKLEKYDGALCE